MLTSLRLERFKSFPDATLHLGPITTLFGTNASGKSNLRDAFRFLHGISRGYTLAEIIGEKWIEGGVLQWRGIRGGTREATFRGAPSFAIQVETRDPGFQEPFRYRIDVAIDEQYATARVARESLYLGNRMQFDSHPDFDPPNQQDLQRLRIRLPVGSLTKKMTRF